MCCTFDISNLNTHQSNENICTIVQVCLFVRIKIICQFIRPCCFLRRQRDNDAPCYNANRKLCDQCLRLREYRQHIRQDGRTDVIFPNYGSVKENDIKTNEFGRPHLQCECFE